MQARAVSVWRNLQVDRIVHTLEASHADGKEYRHGPELCCAWVQAVPWIGEEDESEIDMEHRDGGKDDFDIANLDAESGAALV